MDLFLSSYCEETIFNGIYVLWPWPKDEKGSSTSYTGNHPRCFEKIVIEKHACNLSQCNLFCTGNQGLLQIET